MGLFLKMVFNGVIMYNGLIGIPAHTSTYIYLGP